MAAERRRGSDTRAQIHQVALGLFTEHGYDATSMRQIAEQLGISKAALYYHFDSKEAIIHSLFDERLAALDELIAWAEAQPRTPDLPARIARRWFAVASDGGLRLNRCVVANHHSVAALAKDKDGFRKRLTRLYALVTGPEATVQEQLRVRMALLSLNFAVMAAHGLDADDDQIAGAAAEAAAALAPELAPGRPGSPFPASFLGSHSA